MKISKYEVQHALDAAKNYWEALIAQIPVGFIIAFCAAVFSWVVERSGWNSGWSTPARAALNEHFAPNSIICFLAVADLGWGVWLLVTCLNDNWNNTESGALKKLISFSEFIVTYVSLSVGLLLGIFVYKLFFLRSVSWDALKLISGLTVIVLLLHFVRVYNEQQRRGNSIGFAIFGVGLLFQGLYCYLALIVYPPSWHY